MSEKKQQQNLFEQSVFQRLTEVADGIGLYWWRWKRSDRTILMSPRLKRALNIRADKESIEPEELSAKVHPEDWEKNLKLIDRLYTGVDELYELEFRVMLEGGEWKWYYNRGMVIENDAEGKPEVISGACLDISGRYSSLISRMESAEEVYRNIFETANDRIAIYEPNGKPILMNEAFHQVLGFERDEFMALTHHQQLHSDDLDYIRKEVDDLKKYGRASSEYRVRHKDGHYLNMSSRIVLLGEETEQGRMALCIIRDVTDQRRNIEELRQAKEKAEESDKLKSAFLANMSHEIRTPMNSIIGFSGLLKTPGLSEEQQAHYVKRITDNSESLLALISDIIDLARIESNQLSIVYGRTRISTLIKEMEAYAREEARRMARTEVEVRVRMDPDDCEIETDVLRITQILKNLINNALKFTQKGSVEISCTQPRKEMVRFIVKDTGIGIAPEHSGQIFEQFRQLDGSNTRKFGGTGLGLAICKNLVSLLGGRIWVESAPGKGAAFMLELPNKAGKRIEESPRETRPDVKARQKGNLSILVVDDEPDTQELYRDLLKQMGHRVRLASNAYQALQILEQHGMPDLILMDIQLPVLSGIDALRIIRERYDMAYVVAQSAFALSGDRKRFMEEGFDDYLAKPFTRAQLEKVLFSANI